MQNNKIMKIGLALISLGSTIMLTGFILVSVWDMTLAGVIAFALGGAIHVTGIRTALVTMVTIIRDAAWAVENAADDAIDKIRRTSG